MGHAKLTADIKYIVHKCHLNLVEWPTLGFLKSRVHSLIIQKRSGQSKYRFRKTFSCVRKVSDMNLKHDSIIEVGRVDANSINCCHHVPNINRWRNCMGMVLWTMSPENAFIRKGNTFFIFTHENKTAISQTVFPITFINMYLYGLQR